MKSDAIKSINYVRKNSSAESFSEYEDLKIRAKEIQNYTIEKANSDARRIWTQSCLNAKSMKVEPTFIFYQRYPKINMLHIAKLFSDTNQTVKYSNGVIDCEKPGKYSTDTYTSGIDIRNN
jgi:hypothetical protein